MALTRSKEEAIALLDETHSYFVRYGQFLAVQICLGPEGSDTVFRSADVHRAFQTHPGLCHTKLIRDEMQARGLFDGYAGSMKWAGAIFRGKAFRPDFEAGEFYYAEEERNIHDKRLLWWEIADHTKAGEMAEPLEPERYKTARGAFRRNDAAVFGSEVHRMLAIESALVAIREHALRHRREQESFKSGLKIELAPSPAIKGEVLEWLLKMTAVVE